MERLGKQTDALQSGSISKRKREKEKEESSGVKHRKCISVAMLKPDMDGTR